MRQSMVEFTAFTFNKNSDLHVKSLHEAFLTIEFKDKKYALKMILVLFVEQILMGQDYRHEVFLWLLRLVKDIKEFNQFVWENVFPR